MGDLSTVVGGYTTVLAKDSLEREGQGKGKREKGKGKREKGKGKREKGKGKRKQGKGSREKEAGKRKQGKGSREKEAGKRKQGKWRNQESYRPWVGEDPVRFVGGFESRNPRRLVYRRVFSKMVLVSSLLSRVALS